jgi:hypothetical protein
VFTRPSAEFERLPDIAASANVLIMPYIDAPVTRAMQPLKLKEYLATGLPVIARALPSTEPWADACDISESANQFAAKVLYRVSSGTPEDQIKSRNQLESESWARKSNYFEKFLTEPKIDYLAVNLESDQQNRK